jgi:tetratricopeptide (TPR) repeat protein
MKSIRFYLIILLVYTATIAEGSYKSRIYQAYINDNMYQWQKVIDEMEAKPSKSDEFVLELVNYQYGYIGYSLGTGKEDIAEKYLELAENNVDYLIEESYALSMAYAYQSAFYGYRIALNNFKATFLGPKSKKYALSAIQHNNRNPLGYVQEGNILFFTPATFGGSKSEAVKNYQKALGLMEENQTELVNDWNYLNILMLVADAFIALENYDQAEYYFKKILLTEPDFLFVKHELYPEFLKKVDGVS